MPIIDLSRIFYYATIITFFEIIKILNNEPILEATMKILFFISILLTFYKINNILAFFIFSYEVLECASWIFTHSGFNNQVLLAIDLNWCYEHHFSLFFGFTVIVTILVAISQFRISTQKQYQIPWKKYSVLVVMSFIYLYHFAYTFLSYLYPYEQMDTLPEQAKKLFFRRLDHFLNDNISVLTYGHEGKKNLIILEMESLEQQLLGRFNKMYPHSMPYLSNLSNYGTFVERVETQPYTTWSVASLFSAQCNLPLLMTGKKIFNDASFHLLDQHRCVGDYLKKEGYKLFSYICNVFIAGFKNLLSKHGYEANDYKNHRFNLDYDLFEFVGDKVIPNLTQKVNQPFVLHIANADTHPFPNYIIDKRCKKYLPKGYNKLLKSFNCLDIILKKFLTKVEKSGLLNNTEVVIYGDHVLMSREWKGANIIEPRSILFILPFHNRMKKTQITKRTSLYDMAPTLIDLAGIRNYAPRFPFGESIFSQKVGLTPDNRHFRFIYDFFSDKMSWDKEVTCKNKKGFCKTT